MAEWSKNKVEPSAINGGKEFVKGDNLAVNELNAIANNSFFASERAESAEQKVNSFVEEKGKTAVTIEGEVQSKWSADFIEKEKSKSLNLWTYGDIQGANGKTTIILDKPLPAGMYYIKYYYEHDSTHMYATIRMGLYDEDGVVLQSVLDMYGSSGYLDVGAVLFVRPIKKIEFGVTSPSNSDIVYEGNYKFSDIMISTEPLKVYEKPRGAITHNEDAPVVFAESERQKSKNLFGILTSKNESQYDVSYNYNSETQELTINGTVRSGNSTWLSLFPNEEWLTSGTYTFQIKHNSGSTVNSGFNGIFLKFNDGDSDVGTYSMGISDTHKTITFTKPVYLRVISFQGDSGSKYDNYKIQFQLETGDTPTDWQPYNGAIVHEKQLKEAVEKRGLLYQNNNTAIQIQSSSLTTLSDYFNLFNLDKTKVYNCYKAFNQTTNFTDLLNLPSTIANEALFVLISLDVNGEAGENNYYSVYKITIFNSSHSNCHIGYMGKGYDNVVRVIGWTKIGG